MLIRPRPHGAKDDERFVRRDGGIDILRARVTKGDRDRGVVVSVVSLGAPQSERSFWILLLDEVDAPVACDAGGPGARVPIDGGRQVDGLSPRGTAPVDPPQVAGRTFRIHL